MTFADSRMFQTAVAPVLAIRGRIRWIASLTADVGRTWLDALRRAPGQAGQTLREGLARDIQEEAEPVPALPAPFDWATIRDQPLDEPDPWERRAKAAEAHAADLEMRLAEAERNVLELRSRNVCLQGKLAAANATARYQSLALELDGATQTATSDAP